MAKSRRTKSFFQMSDDERDADVAPYDAGVEFEQTEPLTPAERTRWERAHRTAARAPSGAPRDVRIIVALDPDVLATAQAMAKQSRKSLSAFINDLLTKASKRRAS